MAHSHPSTPTQKAQSVSQLIAHSGEYGLVTRLSRESGASRVTLYHWKQKGLNALTQIFGSPEPTSQSARTKALHRAILILLVEGHATYRGVAACLSELGFGKVSLAQITSVVQIAQQRAVAWFSSHAPSQARPLALDEIYGNDRQGAYLSVVDAKSFALWAAYGPVAVDADSWLLVLWECQAHGLRWYKTISDGGRAIATGLNAFDPQAQHGRDVWHILAYCARIEGRLSGQIKEWQAQALTVARQAARLAAGKKALGSRPVSDVSAHSLKLSEAQRIVSSLHYLNTQLHELLEVVIWREGHLLDRLTRLAELEAVLALLDELSEQAPSKMQAELKLVKVAIKGGVSGALSFVCDLEELEQKGRNELGESALALIGWAWQRRAILGPSKAEIVSGFGSDQQAMVTALIEQWEGTVRASSAAENWHSILRPHLAVHRVLSNGLLALLGLWHNHRKFQAGVHRGHSPLELSGCEAVASLGLVRSAGLWLG